MATDFSGAACSYGIRGIVFCSLNWMTKMFTSAKKAKSLALWGAFGLTRQQEETFYFKSRFKIVFMHS